MEPAVENSSASDDESGTSPFSSGEQIPLPISVQIDCSGKAVNEHSLRDAGPGAPFRDGFEYDEGIKMTRNDA